MKPKTMILMVVAVVCGLAASYMTSRLLADKAPPPPANTVTVLVSKQKINAWTPMKKPEDLFVQKEVPEGTYSPKCITDFKDLKNQALKAPLNQDMPVTKDDLLSEQTAGLVAELKNGERAVAIRVTPESLAGGFVLPGSKVDVMFTMKRGDGDSKAQIILQDMLVLAVDMKNTREDGQQSMLGSTATLAAKPDEAEGTVAGGVAGRPAPAAALAARPGAPEIQAGHHRGPGAHGAAAATTASRTRRTWPPRTTSRATLPNLPKLDKTPSAERKGAGTAAAGDAHHAHRVGRRPVGLA